MNFYYTVYISPKESDDVISKQSFQSYDEAVEFGETWKINGFTYCIVEHT